MKNLHKAEYFKNQSNGEVAWPEGLKPYLSEGSFSQMLYVTSSFLRISSHLLFVSGLIGDTLGLTPDESKELAVNALGGCVYLLKNYLLDQQLLAQKRFQTYVPPDHNVGSSNKGLDSVTSMVLDALTINNLKILGGEGSLMTTLDHCCTAFGKR